VKLEDRLVSDMSLLAYFKRVNDLSTAREAGTGEKATVGVNGAVKKVNGRSN